MPVLKRGQKITPPPASARARSAGFQDLLYHGSQVGEVGRGHRVGGVLRRGAEPPVQRHELGTGERASLAATAGGIATGFIATPLGESIGRALDLDIFEITTSTEGDTLGAGITIGDQIGDRTFLKLRQQFGEHPTSEFMLEYRLADFLRLVGSAAPETSGAANRIGQRRVERAGIDLIFFFSY